MAYTSGLTFLQSVCVAKQHLAVLNTCVYVLTTGSALVKCGGVVEVCAWEKTRTTEGDSWLASISKT